LWYFRDVLVLPDVRAATMEEGKVQAAKKKSTKKSRAGFFSKIKNIFKKKEKQKQADSTTLTTEQPVLDSAQTAKPKKKFLGGLFGKKTKVDKTKPDKKPDEAKKEEEDDGF